jgi:hypothetical protein
MPTFDNDVYAELNAQWNAVVIAKPTFYVGDQGGVRNKPQYISIKEHRGKLDPATIGTVPMYKKVRNALIKITATNSADLELYNSEVFRIIAAKKGDGYYWILDDFDPSESLKKNELIFGVKEIKISASW